MLDMIAQALWIVAQRRGEIRPQSLPPLGPDQVLVRTLFSGISRGTERLVFEGRVPPTLYPLMRCPLQEGTFPFPVKYGYAAVGVVEDGPPAWRERTVFILHPHQDRFVAPLAMCIPVPDGLPAARAVLAANAETALNVLWDAQPLLGERCLIIGAGVVGLLIAHLAAQIPGLTVAVYDRDPQRRTVVEALGLRFVTVDEAPSECELIIHASGDPAGLRLALARAAFEGRIIEASWYGTAEATLPLGEAFHPQRLRLVSSQVGAVAPRMRGRRSHADRLALALSLLTDPRLDQLLGPWVAFAELPARLGELLSSPAGQPAPLCPVVTY